MNYITIAQFKEIVSQDGIFTYVNGESASFMFDDAADELNVYHDDDECGEEFVETVRISDNMEIATMMNEIILKANDITDTTRPCIAINIFKKVPFILSDSIDVIPKKYT